jgi:hypothetical protein
MPSSNSVPKSRIEHKVAVHAYQPRALAFLGPDESFNATVGFESLAKATTPSKSLMRMFDPKGNPRANNLFAVIGKLRRVSGVRLAVASVSRRRAA